jgi:hypothetical protein
MGDQTYREILDSLQADRDSAQEALVRLDAEREQAIRRLAHLDATIKTMTALLENAPLDESLADACRHVLRKAKGRPLTPIQVRDEVGRKGYNLKLHTNQMAAIHGVLKRVADTPDFQAVNNGQFYRWRPPVPVTPKKEGK